jgi:hypothetical protein
MQWKVFVYFMNMWPILLPFDILYSHLVHFVAMWYIFPRFGILCQEKSGNPGLNSLFGNEAGDQTFPEELQMWHFSRNCANRVIKVSSSLLIGKIDVSGKNKIHAENV